MSSTSYLSPVSSVSSDGGKKSGVHSFTPFIGYCFTVNYILGVGVLGMPYAFYKGGYILTPIVLVCVTIVAIMTANWVADAHHRARHIIQQQQQLSSPPPLEFNGIVDVFLGPRFRRIYEIMIFVYLCTALWAYVSVFASSTASHLPISFLNGGSDCDVYKNHSTECSNLYLFYVGLFAAFVLPVSCLDLTEMIWFQILLSAFRFIALGTMMVTSIVAMESYPNPLLAIDRSSAPYISDISAFNWAGLGTVFPVAIYGQIFHHGIPGLARPFKTPSRIPFVFTCVMFTTVSMYICLGVIVSLYYGSSVEQTCTLNWAHYNGQADPQAQASLGAEFISYLVVLFPPIDVLSAYPLNCIALGNNLASAFIRNPAKLAKRRYLIPFRLFSCLVPIGGAMIVKDLDTVLKYAGCLGVWVAFVFPTVLQYASLRKCRLEYPQWFDGPGVLYVQGGDPSDEVIDPGKYIGLIDSFDDSESSPTRVPLSLSPEFMTQSWIIIGSFIFSVSAFIAILVLNFTN